MLVTAHPRYRIRDKVIDTCVDRSREIRVTGGCQTPWKGSQPNQGGWEVDHKLSSRTLGNRSKGM